MELNPIGLAVPVFVVLIAIEYVWARLIRRKLFRLNDTVDGNAKLPPANTSSHGRGADKEGAYRGGGAREGSIFTESDRAIRRQKTLERPIERREEKESTLVMLNVWCVV